MNRIRKSVFAAAVGSIVTLGSGTAFGADVMLKLSGANEVPPVTTSASGEGKISVGDDGSVSGSVMTKGIQGTAAHIHMGAARKNGPAVVRFTKDGDVYKAPSGAKLDTD